MADDASTTVAKPGSVLVSFIELIAELGSPGKPPITNAHEVSELLPHLCVLKHKLLAGRSNDPDFVTWQWRLDMLPYSLQATYAAYMRFTDASQKAVADHENQMGHGTLTLRAADTLELRFALDNFLDAARRTQNALMPFLKAAINPDLPESLNDLMKGLGSKHTLPRDIEEVLTNYWVAKGRSLKDYRDLAQHGTLVASHTTLFRGNDGRTGMNILLPSNPSVQKKRELVWGAPPVHAQPFLQSQIRHFIGTVFYITKLLTHALPGDWTHVVGVYPRYPLSVGSPTDGYCPGSRDKIEANILSLLEKIDTLALPPLKLELPKRPARRSEQSEGSPNGQPGPAPRLES